MARPSKRVVVTGYEVMTPLGGDVASTFDAAREGRSGIDYLRKFDPANLPCQIAGESIGIQGHAHPFLAEKPVVVFFSRLVQAFQLCGTFYITGGHNLNEPDQLGHEIIPMPVQMLKQRMNGIEVSAQPSIEMAQIATTNLGFELSSI